jgi:hypothetical protein
MKSHAKKHFVGLLVLTLLAWFGGATTAHADVLGATVSATFTDPVLVGNVANDPAPGELTFVDNSTTATYSGVGTNSISWGTGPDLGIPAGEQFSQLTFMGASNINLSSSTPQTIGTISYLNGTSDLDSLIFGVTINFYAANGSTYLGSDNVIITTTENQYSGTGLTPQQLQTDADYINICGNSSNICGESLESYEDSETGQLSPVVANLQADLDFNLTGITVQNSSSNLGTVGNLPALAQVPEPSALVLTLTALGGCVGLFRRRRSLR